jgi:hypothetical protein
MWVLDHLDDLESDFSVFHRIEDMYSLDGPLFFRRAHRISAYAGVMAARVMEQETRRGPSGGGQQPAGRQGSGSPGDSEAGVAALQLAGVVERTQV